jgi:Fe-S-cluster-containing hydrogenase component 2
MIVTKPEFCPQNHRCPTVPRCPAGAIKQAGVAAPTVDQELCIDCGKCAELCNVFVRQ